MLCTGDGVGDVVLVEAAVGPDRHMWLLGASMQQPSAARGPLGQDASARTASSITK